MKKILILGCVMLAIAGCNTGQEIDNSNNVFSNTETDPQEYLKKAEEAKIKLQEKLESK